MSLLFGSILPYVACAVFLLVLARRTGGWLRRPVPFPLTLVQGRATAGGQAAAATRELLLFAALFRADRRLWLAAWTMHAVLALILVGHVVGIACLGQQFVWLGVTPQTSTVLSHAIGTGAGLVLALCLIGLTWRRGATAELRRLSGVDDYALLLLLLAISATGMALRALAAPADLAAVRTYLAGLLTLHPTALPTLPLFAVHFTLVNLLLLWFPFSKLA
jgi:nitrate reductase gamma subunit